MKRLEIEKNFELELRKFELHRDEIQHENYVRQTKRICSITFRTYLKIIRLQVFP